VLAIGTSAVPILSYSFTIINWHQEDIKKLDRKTRKMLTIHGQHHPRAVINRLHVHRKEGRREPMQTEGAYIAEVMKFMEYVESKDLLTQIVRTHQHNTNSTVLKTVRDSKNFFPSRTKQIKNIIAQNIKEKWEVKRCMDDSHIA
jgi:hypothetical protein